MRKGRISRSRNGQGEGRTYSGSRTDLGKPSASDFIPPDESVSRWKFFLRKVVPGKLARPFHKVPWSHHGDTLEVDSAKATQLPLLPLSGHGHASPRASSSSKTLSSYVERISPEFNASRICESPSGGLHLPAEPAPLTGHAGFQESSGSQARFLDGETTPRNFDELETSESPSERRAHNQVSAAQEIVVGLPGDDPSRKRLMVASLDTQCKGLNLMSFEAWDRLNEDGRGVLESAGDAFVRNLGPHKLRVLGVIRGVEWHFKNGYRTYTDDFHVICMRDFDVLIGSECIYRHGLLQPGPDLMHHMARDAEDEGSIYIEVNSPEH